MPYIFIIQQEVLAPKCLEPLVKRSHVAIWKWLQCIDINEFTIDRRREKRRIKCIMIDEYDNSKGRGILVMDSI